VRTFAEREVFAPSEVRIWRRARAAVAMVRFDGCRSHELARAVLVVLSARKPTTRAMSVEDGRVGAVDHSWIRFQKTGDVLDVCRPGTLPGVLLVDAAVAQHYEVGLWSCRTDIRDDAVKRLIMEMTV